MSLPRLLAAHTDLLAPNPAFIAFEEQAGDTVEIHIRATPKKGQVSGTEAAIVLSSKEFIRTLTDALNNYGLARASTSPSLPKA